MYPTNRLKSVVIPPENRFQQHNTNFADCWILQELTVFLVVTDGRQMETMPVLEKYLAAAKKSKEQSKKAK